MKTLVIGLGNPILGDDGVGWRVAEEVKRELPPLLEEQELGTRIDIDCISLGGLSLMEHLIGYDRAILIDAFAVDGQIGSVQVLKLSELPNYSAFHTTSPHDTSLQNAIELGRSMGAHLPEDVLIVGITTKKCFEFSEDLTSEVRSAVPIATKAALDLLEAENKIASLLSES
jgi:hydrogenase maturation protease